MVAEEGKLDRLEAQDIKTTKGLSSERPVPKTVQENDSICKKPLDRVYSGSLYVKNRL